MTHVFSSARTPKCITVPQLTPYCVYLYEYLLLDQYARLVVNQTEHLY